jgi:hypothetical protein
VVETHSPADERESPTLNVLAAIAAVALGANDVRRRRDRFNVATALIELLHKLDPVMGNE